MSPDKVIIHSIVNTVLIASVLLTASSVRFGPLGSISRNRKWWAELIFDVMAGFLAAGGGVLSH